MEKITTQSEFLKRIGILGQENNTSEFYEKYLQIRKPNIHKMKSIPVCILPKKL